MFDGALLLLEIGYGEPGVRVIPLPQREDVSINVMGIDLMVLTHIYRFTDELYAEVAHSLDFCCYISHLDRIGLPKISDAFLAVGSGVIGSRYCQSSMVWRVIHAEP